MDTGSFMLSVKTKNIINDLKNLEDIFDLSIFNENHKVKKINFRKVKKETPTIFWIEEFFCLRCKMYSFECGNQVKIN